MLIYGALADVAILDRGTAELSTRAVASIYAVYGQTGRESYDSKVEWRGTLYSHT